MLLLTASDPSTEMKTLLAWEWGVVHMSALVFNHVRKKGDCPPPMQALLRAYMCLHVLPQMREKHVAEQWTLKCVFTGFGIMWADSCISFIWAWFEFFQIWTDGARGLAVFFLLLFFSPREAQCASLPSVFYNWRCFSFLFWWVMNVSHHENTITLTFPCQFSGQIIWN